MAAVLQNEMNVNITLVTTSTWPGVGDLRLAEMELPDVLDGSGESILISSQAFNQGASKRAHCGWDRLRDASADRSHAASVVGHGGAAASWIPSAMPRGVVPFVPECPKPGHAPGPAARWPAIAKRAWR